MAVVDDLEDPVSRERMALLAREGFRFWLATQGRPDAALLDLLERLVIGRFARGMQSLCEALR